MSHILDDNTMKALTDTLNLVPQVQAWKAIRSAVTAKDLAQQIIQGAGLQSLDDGQKRAVMAFMCLSAKDREVLAAEVIGSAIEESLPGVWSWRIWPWNWFNGLKGKVGNVR